MSSSDNVIGITLLAVVAAYSVINQSQAAPKEAILGEISQIMNDLESEMEKAELPNGMIPAHTNLYALLRESPSRAVIGQVGDAPLVPDIVEDETRGNTLGGCVIGNEQWAMLRMDHSALTEITDNWHQPVIKICLDRNGSAGPNLEGYDVIWLSFSRISSPHITMIPAKGPFTPRS
jgi:hypothetical protein